MCGIYKRIGVNGWGVFDVWCIFVEVRINEGVYENLILLFDEYIGLDLVWENLEFEGFERGVVLVWSGRFYLSVLEGGKELLFFFFFYE